MIETVLLRKQAARDFATFYHSQCQLQGTSPQSCVTAHLPDGVIRCGIDRWSIKDWNAFIATLAINRALRSVELVSNWSPSNTCSTDPSTNKYVLAHQLRLAPIIRNEEVATKLMRSVSQCMLISRSLTVVRLTGVPLAVPDCRNLSSALKSNSTVAHLGLVKSCIGDDGFAALAQVIRDSESLVSIDLSACLLSHKSADLLGRAVRSHTIRGGVELWANSLRSRHPDTTRMLGLRRLTLCDNPSLGDRGIFPLVDALKDDTWLKALDLQHCGISHMGACVIQSVLQFNKSIIVLDVRRNVDVEDTILASIASQLSVNREKSEHGNQYCRNIPVKGIRRSLDNDCKKSRPTSRICSRGHLEEVDMNEVVVSPQNEILWLNMPSSNLLCTSSSSRQRKSRSPGSNETAVEVPPVYTSSSTNKLDDQHISVIKSSPSDLNAFVSQSWSNNSKEILLSSSSTTSTCTLTSDEGDDVKEEEKRRSISLSVISPRQHRNLIENLSHERLLRKQAQARMLELELENRELKEERDNIRHCLRLFSQKDQKVPGELNERDGTQWMNDTKLLSVVDGALTGFHRFLDELGYDPMEQSAVCKAHSESIAQERDMLHCLESKLGGSDYFV